MKITWVPNSTARMSLCNIPTMVVEQSALLLIGWTVTLTCYISHSAKHR